LNHADILSWSFVKISIQKLPPVDFYWIHLLMIFLLIRLLLEYFELSTGALTDLMRFFFSLTRFHLHDMRYDRLKERKALMIRLRFAENERLNI
jgi:hypothetical protein